MAAAMALTSTTRKKASLGGKRKRPRSSITDSSSVAPSCDLPGVPSVPGPEVAPPPWASIGGMVQYMPREILVHECTDAPLACIDLSKWQMMMNEEYLTDMERINPSFSGLVVKHIWVPIVPLCSLIARRLYRLTSLDLSFCRVLDDDCVGILAAKCRSLQRINISGCHAVSDSGLKALAKGATSSLTHISLCGCFRVTDRGIEDLVRARPLLAELDCRDCPLVRDRALHRISELKKLKGIGLSGPDVTDDGISIMLSSRSSGCPGGGLQWLALRGCTNVTDVGLRNAYEVPVLYGFRRHSGCAGLKRLEIEGNGLLTDEIFSMLAVACPALQKLVLIDCLGLGSDDALGNLSGLTNLDDLTLQGLKISDNGIAQMLSGDPACRRGLEHLDVRRCIKITNVGVSHIAQRARQLQSLAISGSISITDEGLQAIALNLTSLRELELSSLPLVSDVGVRDVLRRCRVLETVCLAGCAQLTSVGILPAGRLEELKHLDVGRCCRVDARALFSEVRLRALKNLVVSHQPILCPAAIRLIASHQPALCKISLAGCDQIRVADDLSPLLDGYHIRTIDLTGSEVARLPELATLASLSGFRIATLACDGFDGLTCDRELLEQRVVQEARQLATRRNQGATAIQLAWRRRVELIELESAARRQRIAVYFSACRIQAIVLGFIARKKVSRLMSRDAILRLRVRLWLLYVHQAKQCRRADRHCNLVYLRHSWRQLAEHAKEELNTFAAKEIACVALFERQLSRRTLRGWFCAVAPQRKIRVDTESRADILSCFQAKRRLLARWSYNAKKVAIRRERLCRIVQQIVPLAWHNSQEQIFAKAQAEKQYRSVTFRKCFAVLMCANEETRARLQLFRAISRRHHLRRALRGLMEGIKISKWLHASRSRADDNSRRLLTAYVIDILADCSRRHLIRNSLDERADAHLLSSTLKRACSVMRNHPIEAKLMSSTLKMWTNRAVRAHMRRLRARGWGAWQEHHSRRRRILLSVAQALPCGDQGKLRAFWMRWHVWHLEEKADGKHHLLHRMFKQWKVDQQTSASCKSHRSLTLEEDLIESTDSIAAAAENADVDYSDYALQRVEYSPQMHAAAITIQAWARGWMVRLALHRRDVARTWAAIKMQSAFRARVARIRCQKERRYKRIREAVREEHETDEMSLADVESQKLRSYERALIFAERWLWGYRGRRQTSELRRQRQKLLDEENLRLKMEQVKAHEAALAARRELLKQKDWVATQIQRIIRGYLAKRRCICIRRNNKERQAATKLQCVWRVRRAWLESAARRRHRARLKILHSARRSQGRLLRTLGARHRHTQRKLVNRLRHLGLDPMGFNLSIRRQYMDLKRDLGLVLDESREELRAWRAGGLRNKYARIESRQESMNNRMAAGRVSKGNAVLIISHEHKNCGATGRILHINSEDPLHEVAEILLDDGKNRVIYVNLYFKEHKTAPAQPNLLIIDRMEPRQYTNGELQALAGAFLAWSDREREKWNIYAAARTIQCMVRCHQATLRTASLRYKYWSAHGARRHAALAILSNTGTATFSTLYSLLGWKALSTEDAPTEVPVHPPVPAQLDTLLQSLRRIRVLSLERKRRMKERCAELAGKGPDVFKYRTPTMGPVLKNSRPLSAVLSLTLPNRRDEAGGSWAFSSSFTFVGLASSPHLRCNGAALYHGQWARAPKRSALQGLIPHGEGYAEFLDGWGVTVEEMTLYVKVIAASDLPAMDRGMFSEGSDPFVILRCNGRTARTTTRHGTLNPVWKEELTFEVTNPRAGLVVEMWDEDAVGKDFIGHVVIPLRPLARGKAIRETYILRPDPRREIFSNTLRGKPRGSVELELQWLPSPTKDDMMRRMLQEMRAVRLQAWIRGSLARKHVAALHAEKKAINDAVACATSTVQRSWRCRVAREAVRLRKRDHRNAKLLQGFTRGVLARRLAAKQLRQRRAVVNIQCAWRSHMARGALNDLRKQRQAFLSAKATIIQARARGMLVRMKIHVPEPPFTSHPSQWIEQYGRDQEFGSKRTRRVYENVFARCLSLPGTRILTSLGRAEVITFPARPCKGLRSETGAVEAHLGWHHCCRSGDALSAESWRPYAYIPTHNISVRCTVDLQATVIQCSWRSKVARERTSTRMAEWAVAAAGRLRVERQVYIATRVIVIGRRIIRKFRAKQALELQVLELRTAIKLQCAWRRSTALREALNRRQLRDVRVLASSGCSAAEYPAENVLDADERSLWTSEHGKVEDQWITFEIPRDKPVGWLRLRAIDGTAAPRQIRLSCCSSRRQMKQNYWQPALSGTYHRGIRGFQAYQVPHIHASCRYWQVTLINNHGNTSGVILTGVQFLLAKEFSPRIVEEPVSQLIAPPGCGNPPTNLCLKVQASSWPLPTFQWFKDGNLLEGESTSMLQVQVSTAKGEGSFRFRCTHCKHAREGVPVRVQRAKCSNCGTLWAAEGEEDGSPADIADKSVLRIMSALDEELSHLESLRNTWKEGENELEDSVLAIRGRKRDALIAFLKQRAHHQQELFEGSYVCRVTNIRGGGAIPTSTETEPIIIAAIRPEPVTVHVALAYVPRERTTRRYWAKYTSAFGWFSLGQLSGRVQLNYADGAVYDGPYVDEQWLDVKGSVASSARVPGHWGKWLCADGTCYEGPFVDNHFDIENICGTYQVLDPAGQVYEGEYLDETRHGFGHFKYSDGSVYTGQWYCGLRQGFGTLTAKGGSSYNGSWSHDLIHGQGVWRWPDGSTYVGESQHGVREGKGIYVSGMGDAYVGSFAKNKFDGQGYFQYCDGSAYEGGFLLSLRHGKGIFKDEKGVRYEGTFNGDLRNGEFVVKTPVYIAAEKRYEDEIRTGMWEAGIFQEWTSAPIYPYATKQFYELFEKDPLQYDGVYAMMVARKLPELPRGVNPDHARVVSIVERIAREGGALTASDTISRCEEELRSLQPDFDRSSNHLANVQAIEYNARQVQQDQAAVVRSIETKLKNIEDNATRLALEIEQFYADDKDGRKQAFDAAVAKLSELSTTDWFEIRNYDEPPALVANLMQAVCVLMNAKESWASAVNLLCSSSQNMMNGDEQALAVTYDCKLVYLLNLGFDVYARVGASSTMTKLGMFVMDPRFESGNYFLNLYGPALGPLVDLVRAAYNYVLHAAHIKPTVETLRGVKATVGLTQKTLQEQQDSLEQARQAVTECEKNTEEAARALRVQQTKVHKVNVLLEHARSLRTVYEEEEAPSDAYAQLEAGLDSSRMEVEVTLELLIGNVEARNVNQPHQQPVKSFNIFEFVESQAMQQEARGLYSACVAKISSCLGCPPPWNLLNGEEIGDHVISSFISRTQATQLAEAERLTSIQNWSSAFPDEELAADRALEAVQGCAPNLPDHRRAEASAWAEVHLDAISAAKVRAVAAFEASQPEQDLPYMALQALEADGSPVLLGARIWADIHPQKIRAVKEEQVRAQATVFDGMAGGDPEVGAQLVLKARAAADASILPYAEAWATFHLAEIMTAEEAEVLRRANDFQRSFPNKTAQAAARVTVCAKIQGESCHVPYSEHALAWAGAHAEEMSAAEQQLSLYFEEQEKEIRKAQHRDQRRLAKLVEALKDKGSTEGNGRQALLEERNAELEKRRAARSARARDEEAQEHSEIQAKFNGPSKTSASKGKRAAGKSKAAKTSVAGAKAAQERARLAERAAERQKLMAEEDEADVRELILSLPPTKLEDMRNKLAGHVADRLSILHFLQELYRLRIAEVEQDNSHLKALRDESLRPSAAEAEHDRLLEMRDGKIKEYNLRAVDLAQEMDRVRQFARVQLEGIDLSEKGTVSILPDATEALVARPDVESSHPSSLGPSDTHSTAWQRYYDEGNGAYYQWNSVTGESFYE